MLKENILRQTIMAVNLLEFLNLENRLLKQIKKVAKYTYEAKK